MNRNIFHIKGLNRAYKIALLTIALLAFANCYILVKKINQQKNSSRIINISGRQRMLSQNITKNLLLLNSDYPGAIKQENLKELNKNFASWTKAHHALQYGDTAFEIPALQLSAAITRYFKEIDPYYSAIAMLCQKALLGKMNKDEWQTELKILLNNEKQFLAVMDKITFQFDAEAKEEVTLLKKYEIIFLLITLATLLIEAFFIFKPTIALVNKNIADKNELNAQLLLSIKKKEEQDTRLQEEKRNSIKQMIVAEETERKRIAADLHDSLGQLVLSLKMNLIKLMDSKLFPEAENRILSELIDSADLIAGEIRAISYNLMPATLAEFGIGTCIEQYISGIQNLSDAHIVFIQENPGNLRVEPIKEILIYRVSQELLNNAIKHADASEIVIQLLFHKDVITLMIEDNGKGFDYDQQQITTAAKGSGLRNIKTRLESIGATLTIDTSKEYGTTTIIQIPYTL